MMAMLSKDIVNMIYRLIHNDYVIALNKQYHDKFEAQFIGVKQQFRLLCMRSSPYTPFNYRYMDKYRKTYKSIFRFMKNKELWITVAELPKHYFTLNH